MNKSNLARDKSSKAVVSVDNQALDEYKRAKSVLRKKDNRINSLEDRLSELEKIVQKLAGNIN